MYHIIYMVLQEHHSFDLRGKGLAGEQNPLEGKKATFPIEIQFLLWNPEMFYVNHF